MPTTQNVGITIQANAGVDSSITAGVEVMETTSRARLVACSGARIRLLKFLFQLHHSLRRGLPLLLPVHSGTIFRKTCVYRLARFQMPASMISMQARAGSMSRNGSTIAALAFVNSSCMEDVKEMQIISGQRKSVIRVAVQRKVHVNILIFVNYCKVLTMMTKSEQFTNTGQTYHG